MKSQFLKRVLGISKMTQFRLVYELARETLLIEDIRYSKLLPYTSNVAELLRIRREKKAAIWEDFTEREAMVDRNWSGPNQKMRSVIIRLAVHSFHHKFCGKTYFHHPSENCVCKLCEKQCERYHFEKCGKRTKSLNEYSKEV